MVTLNSITSTTVGTSVPYSVLSYSDHQAITKEAYKIMAPQNPCVLFHSYFLPSVTLGGSVVQCIPQCSEGNVINIAPIKI